MFPILLEVPYLSAIKTTLDIRHNELHSTIQVMMEELSAIKKMLTKKQHKKEKLYSYEEASQILNISKEGLKTRIKRNQIKRISNGSKPSVRGTEINRYLESLNPGEIFDF